MITNLDAGQRWKEGRAGFRVYGERINPLEYEVAEIPDDTTAKAFVLAHHYSGSYPAAVRRFGLYKIGQYRPAPRAEMFFGPKIFAPRETPPAYDRELVGVAVFDTSGPAVLGKWFHGHVKESLSLGRFVLLDEVPGDGETFFLARCFDQLRRIGYFGVVSFADPMPRMRRGELAPFMPGHIGKIYIAFSGLYAGRTKQEAIHLFDDATAFAARGRAKIRAYAMAENDADLKIAKGWAGAVKHLENHGAPKFVFKPGDRRAVQWVDHAIAQLTRCFRHPGQYRFVWGLSATARGQLRKTMREFNLDNLKHPRIVLPAIPYAPLVREPRVRRVSTA